MANLTDYATSYFGWAWKAPPQLKELLNTQQIAELENLRKEFKIQEENFLMFVGMSIQLGKKIIKRDYDTQRKLWPSKSDKEILRHLLIEDLSCDPELMKGATSADCEQLIVLADEAMRNINTLDQLTDYVASLEQQSNPDYYSTTTAKRIDEIISTEKIIHCRKCRQRLRITAEQMDLAISCPHCGHSFLCKDDSFNAVDDVKVTRVGLTNIPDSEEDVVGWLWVIGGGVCGVLFWLRVIDTPHISPVWSMFAFSAGGWLGWWLYKLQ